MLLVCTAALAAGFFAVLLLNTVISQGAFRQHELEIQLILLAEKEEALARAVQQAEAPREVEKAARKLGMVPAAAPVFLRLSDGKVLGEPVPAPRRRLRSTSPAPPGSSPPRSPPRPAARPATDLDPALDPATGIDPALDPATGLDPALPTRPPGIAASARPRRPRRQPRSRPDPARGEPVSSVAPPRAPRTRPDPAHAPAPRRFSRGEGRTRAIYLTFAVLMLLSIYAGRVFDLMVLKGDDLATMGQNQRSRTLPLPADRGPIYDSEGAPLAITVESRNVTADQNLIEDPAEAAARLAPMLGMDQAELQAELTGDDMFVYITKGLTPEQWRQIKDLDIVGIFSEKTTKRTYPAGTLAANVLGFVNSEGVGPAGWRWRWTPGSRASTARGPSSRARPVRPSPRLRTSCAPRSRARACS